MTLNKNIYIPVIMFALLNANTPWDYTLSLGSGYDSNVTVSYTHLTLPTIYSV